jgi:hypothetical protein
MDEDTLPLIAQHPEHCFECYHLIRPGETYHQTVENTVLCPECAGEGASMEVLDTLQATDDLVVEVGDDRYPSLEAAQAAALKPVAQALASAIREALASGALVVSEGKVVFAEDAILPDDPVHG